MEWNLQNVHDLAIERLDREIQLLEKELQQVERERRLIEADLYGKAA